METEMKTIDVVFDMETSDQDDFLALCLLCGHPRVNLQAVTITPGSSYQVGLVRWLLNQFELDIPVGARNIMHPKKCVSDWHYRAYGDIPPATEYDDAAEVLYGVCDENTVLVTGAALTNVQDAIRLGSGLDRPFTLGLWNPQGGFAGEGVVPPEDQLDKFKGLSTCPTFNFNGNPKAAFACLEHPGIKERRLVSKNVCHGVVYNQFTHTFLKKTTEPGLGLQLIMQGMEAYLERKPKGKKFHDPLAVCAAIDPTVITWAEVEMYRERGKWGARLKPGSGTWISVKVDTLKMVEILSEC